MHSTEDLRKAKIYGSGQEKLSGEFKFDVGWGRAEDLKERVIEKFKDRYKKLKIPESEMKVFFGIEISAHDRRNLVSRYYKQK